MATAPTPGVSTTGPQRVRMRLFDRTLEYVPSAITIREKMAVRHATGLPYEAFEPSSQIEIGEDTFAVMWWIARRANGETNLSLDKLLNEWVTPRAGDLDLELIDDENDETDDAGKSVPA